MNVACPECSTVYRIDPSRVPGGGVGTRCRECETVFRVDPGAPRTPGVVTTAAPVEAAAPATPPQAETATVPDATEPAAPEAREETAAVGEASPAGPAPAFGPQDPQTRARRLARALVSDIKVYNPDKWEASRSRGSLRKDFRDEIMKSWEEYVEQVGEEMAKKTPYFRDALNDILAAGERVF